MTGLATVEDAYKLIVQEILAFIGGEAWDSAEARYGIFTDMVSGEWCRFYGEERDRSRSRIPIAVSRGAVQAIKFLRADLMKTTGQRIWGAACKLLPSGKFSIEYDYNKPDDYDDTDDLMSGDEINKALSGLGRVED